MSLPIITLVSIELDIVKNSQNITIFCSPRLAPHHQTLALLACLRVTVQTCGLHYDQDQGSRWPSMSETSGWVEGDSDGRSHRGRRWLHVAAVWPFSSIHPSMLADLLVLLYHDRNKTVMQPMSAVVRHLRRILPPDDCMHEVALSYAVAAQE